MIFNNFEKIEICGTLYKLKYNLRAVAGVEKDLGETFVYDLPEQMKVGKVPSLTDFFTFFKHGFVEGNPKAEGWKDEEVAELFEAAVCEYSLLQVAGLCVKALKTAGILEFSPKKTLIQKPPEGKTNNPDAHSAV